MRRVVITGAGIVSCLGNDLDTVTTALKNGQSGLRFNQSYADHGFKAQVSGSIDPATLDTSGIDRKLKRFFSDASLYAYVSALAAIKHAGLTVEDVANDPRIGIVAGSGQRQPKTSSLRLMPCEKKACVAWAPWQYQKL